MSRILPPPPGDSFGFNVLFALPIRLKSKLAVQLAQFIFHVATDLRSFSNGITLWELTFRVDRKHILGALQFETRDRHQKIQAEAHIWNDSFLATNPITREIISYQMLPRIQICDHAVSTHMRQINRSLRYVRISPGVLSTSFPNYQAEN